MSTSFKILSFILLAGLSVNLTGSSISTDTIKYEVLLDSKLLSDMKVNASLTGTFEMTSGQLILFSTVDQFYLLGWGNIIPFGTKTVPTIGSFAFTPDSVLMIIRNNQLCSMDTLGNLSFMYQLPGNNMGISPGNTVMYVYDRSDNPGSKAVYLIARGGKYLKLLEVPKPVHALVETGNFLYFAMDNAILQYDLASKQLRPLAVLPEKSVIVSLTMDPSSGAIYFSTDNAIYTVKENSIILLSNKFGGFLRYYKGLIVFHPESRLMIRLAGLNDNVIAGAQPVISKKAPEPPVEILTNATIAGLVESGLSEEIIITVIEHARVNFDLGVDAMIDLSNRKVSSRIIMAMRQAMLNQPNE